MQTTGAAKYRCWLPGLFRLSTTAQGRDCALGLLFFAAVQHSSLVGRDHLIRRLCRACWRPGYMRPDMAKRCSLVRIIDLRLAVL